jgi:hypothetical protein
MRRLLVIMTVVGLMAGVYALSPLFAAFQLVQSARAGDVVALRAAVDWDAVRQSLKLSIAGLGAGKTSDPATGPRPSLWTRVKAAVTPAGMVDGLIDRHVTPEGVAGLAARRGSLHSLLVSARLASPTPEPQQDQSLPERVTAFWNRLHRASHVAWDQFEIEVNDRQMPQRSFVTLLTRSGMTWRVTSVRVVMQTSGSKTTMGPVLPPDPSILHY